MIINFIPDYISLYETRWVLNKFKNIHSVRVTALILFIDLLISALIVTPSIFLYYFFTDSEQGLAHTVGLYSITSIFFYSTFYTSFLSWIYGLSYLIMKIFQKWKLHKIFEVEENPISTLGVIATFLVLLLTSTGSYFVEDSSDKTETISIFDRMMCDWQPQVCTNVANLVSDELRKKELMMKGCLAKSSRECIAFSDRVYAESDYSRAAILFEAYCNASQVDKCLLVGMLFWDFEDLEKAQHYFGKACEGKISEACSLAAYSHPKTNENTERSIYYANLGCSQGDGSSCYYLGQMYLQISNPETVKAIQYLELACVGGELYGCVSLGRIYLYGTEVEINYDLANNYLNKACNIESYEGCAELGDIYFKGLGVKANPNLALNYYEKACDNGNARSCLDAGKMYQEGQGTTKNYKEALSYYIMSCEGQNALGCVNSGMFFEYGLGVEVDIDSAISFYKQSCEGGLFFSCTYLGTLYEEQNGSRLELASQYYQAGCEGNDTDGCKNLLRLHKNGKVLSSKSSEFIVSIEKYSKKYNVDPTLILAIIHTKSGFDPKAISNASGYGLMHIIPTSMGIDASIALYGARRIFKKEDLLNADLNIEIGIVYISLVQQRYLANIKDEKIRELASVAAYNSGAGNVARTFNKDGSRKMSKAAPIINALSYNEFSKRLLEGLPYRETKDFVTRVMRLKKYYEILYKESAKNEEIRPLG